MAAPEEVKSNDVLANMDNAKISSFHFKVCVCAEERCGGATVACAKAPHLLSPIGASPL